MKGTIKSYYSYGNIFKSTAEIFYPKSVEELRAILDFCQKNNRSIIPAGTFNSFDLQNSSKDIAISLKAFNRIEFDKRKHTIKVGAGARWGEIFDVVYEHK